MIDREVLLKKGRYCLVEFLGTFIFVLSISVTGYTTNSGAILLAPLAVGLTLAALVYWGGDTSGAHFNPAVSTAMCLNKRITWDLLIFYVLSQLFGGLVASITSRLLVGGVSLPVPKNIGLALFAEFIFTFLLASVVLNATKRPNDFAGVAIGFAMAVGVFNCGGISGGMLNPAPALGLIVIHSLYKSNKGWSYLWIYFVGPVLGGIIAFVVFRFLLNRPKKEQPTQIQFREK